MKARHLVVLAIAYAVAAPASGATLADRSPVAQGHWWNPARAGSGFDILTVRDQVFVVWFTYDASGRPIWYTAGGELTASGTQALPLMQHRWAAGGIAASVAVGSLQLAVRNPELLDATWQIGTTRGVTTIQPLVLSGVPNEIDHTGSWFAPVNSGWGLSVTEQGDFLGGVLFTYDSAGAPTWLAGMGRGLGSSVDLQAFNGSCPACTYLPSSARSVGRLTMSFGGEADATLRSGLNFTMAPGVSVDGASVVQLGRPASVRSADRELATFDTPTALKAYLDSGMLNLKPAGPSLTFSASPPSVPYSTTNLQESGVDEADLVKSDGRLVYAYAYDANGARQPTLRIAEVGNDGGTLALRGTVPLASATSQTRIDSGGLYVQADKVVSVTSGAPPVYSVSAWVTPGAWMRGITNVEVLATSSSGLPATRWFAQIDGYLVSSRRIGDRLYVVSRYVPELPGFVYGATPGAGSAGNQSLLANTPLGALLPTARVNGGASVPLLEASSVYAPPQGTRAPVADLVVVTAIDLASPRIAQAIGIIGSIDMVYASTGNLYLASSRYAVRDAYGALLPNIPAFLLTDIHRVSLGSGGMKIVGSGTVEGTLAGDPDKAAFRMGEQGERLRVVTSSQGGAWGSNANRLTILEPSSIAPGLLRTVSYLPNPRRPETLGKPNENLYGTRFVGDRLYAVTFLKIDPLYVVDLSDAWDPRIAGQVQVPGYSDYLHPLPNGLLLGFGKDARPSGTAGDGQFAWYQGLQVTLFSIDRNGAPVELQRVLVGKRGSDSALLRDHHAFAELARADGTMSFAIPGSIHEGAALWGSGDSTYYAWLESGLMRFDLVGSTASDARLVQLPSLITNRAPQSATSDAAIGNARSVLFRAGTVYVENGRFWRQDAAGLVSGPF